MIQINLYKDAIPEELANQVFTMCANNATSLSTNACPPNDPLYEVSQLYLILEVQAYLSNIGGPALGGRGELLVASEDRSGLRKLLGFLLYMPINGSNFCCGVNYGAVREDARNKGIYTLLLRHMLQRYPSATLSCFVHTVPFYERLGFKIEKSRDTQVQMSTITAAEDMQMPIVDLSRLEGHPLIIQARQQAIMKYGQHGIAQAYIKSTARVKAMRIEAKNYVKKRLAR